MSAYMMRGPRGDRGSVGAELIATWKNFDRFGIPCPSCVGCGLTQVAGALLRRAWGGNHLRLRTYRAASCLMPQEFAAEVLVHMTVRRFKSEEKKKKEDCCTGRIRTNDLRD